MHDAHGVLVTMRLIRPRIHDQLTDDDGNKILRALFFLVFLSGTTEEPSGMMTGMIFRKQITIRLNDLSNTLRGWLRGRRRESKLRKSLLANCVKRRIH